MQINHTISMQYSLVADCKHVYFINVIVKGLNFFKEQSSSGLIKIYKTMKIIEF